MTRDHFLADEDLPHERCGNLGLAGDASEIPRLDELERPPSPGAMASLAIGEEIARRVAGALG